LGAGNVSKKTIRNSLTLIAFLLLLGALLFSVKTLEKLNFFSVSKIELEINGEEENRELLLSDIANLKKHLRKFENVNIWEVEVGEIGKKISQFAWVQDFTVLKSWPNTVEIKLQMAPVAFAVQEKQSLRLYFGNLRSTLISESDLSRDRYNNFPILVTEDSKLTDDVISSTYHTLSLLKHHKYFDLGNIKIITWNSHKGFGIRLKEPKTEVLLGFLDEPEKIDRVTRVIDYLKEHMIEARVIDSNFTKKVLVRLRNQF
jgi:cell division septal protein FtsQ